MLKIHIAELHIHIDGLADFQMVEIKRSLTNLKGTVMATSAEHAQALRDLTAQNEKSRVEQLAALKKLQDALDAAGGTTADVDAAMVELKASIQADDDSNPDAVPVEPPAP